MNKTGFEIGYREEHITSVLTGFNCSPLIMNHRQTSSAACSVELIDCCFSEDFNETSIVACV